MHIVSRQTMVKPLIKIRRERSLPRAGEILVRPGQDVTPVQVVARVSEQRGFYVIPAAEMLAVPAEEVKKYLLVEEGAAILEGTPLLQKSGLFGKKRFLAPADGVLYAVSHGRLILQQTPDLLEIRANLFGVVHNLVANRGVVIETIGALIQATWSAGREGYGKVTLMVNQRDGLLRSNYIGATARGAILVAGRLDNLEVLDRAAENSARGIIVGGVPAGLVPGLKKHSLPVFVTDGFGDRPMAAPLFQLLSQLEGREACLLDSTAFGRPGRPEIVVPIPTGSMVPGPDKPVMRLEAGQKVRILRAPYAGRVGEVVGVHSRSRTTGAGTRLPGVDVQLADGEIVPIPYLNLDLIG